MCSGEDFVETLKRLRYPDAEMLSGPAFDWLFTEKSTIPFLTEFCTLTEANVLTSSEEDEYAMLTQEDFEKIESFELPLESTTFADEIKRQDIQELKEHASHIDSHINLLEEQRGFFKTLEMDLLDKKDDLEKVLLKERKKFMQFEQQELPKTEKKLISSLKLISSTAQEIDSLINNATVDDIYFPTKDSYRRDTKLYLEKEKKLLENITFYLESNFEQFKRKNIEDDSKNDILQTDFQEQQMKEVLLLQKVLKISKENKIKLAVEKRKLNAELEFYKTLKDPNILQSYELPDSVLREKLKKAEESLEKYKKLEQKLQLDCKASITKNVDALCQQVAVACSVEKTKHCKSYLEKMNIPFDILLSQKARLEFFMTFLSMQEEKFENVKCILQHVTDELQQQHSEFLEREAFFESVINKEEPERIEYLTEDSVLFQLYTLLESPENLKKIDLHKITPFDVLQKIENLYAMKNALNKQKDDDLNSHLKTLELLEKKMLSLADAFRNDNHFKEVTDQERSVDVELNRLVMKHSTLEENLKKHMILYKERKKLLSGNQNMSKARKLYVYALTNPEKFNEIIKELKLAVENSRDYQLSTKST